LSDEQLVGVFFMMLDFGDLTFVVAIEHAGLDVTPPWTRGEDPAAEQGGTMLVAGPDPTPPATSH
jgi:hypothetical protein